MFAGVTAAHSEAPCTLDRSQCLGVGTIGARHEIRTRRATASKRERVRPTSFETQSSLLRRTGRSVRLVLISIHSATFALGSQAKPKSSQPTRSSAVSSLDERRYEPHDYGHTPGSDQDEIDHTGLGDQCDTDRAHAHEEHVNHDRSESSFRRVGASGRSD